MIKAGLSLLSHGKKATRKRLTRQLTKRRKKTRNQKKNPSIK